MDVVFYKNILKKIDVNERKPVIDNILNYCKELISV